MVAFVAGVVVRVGEGIARVGGSAGNDDEGTEGVGVGPGVAVTTPDAASAGLAASYRYEDSRSPKI